MLLFARGEAASAETTRKKNEKNTKLPVLITQGKVRRADGEDAGICGYARCADRIQRRPQEVAAQALARLDQIVTQPYPFSPPTQLPSGISTRTAKTCSPPKLGKRGRKKVEKSRPNREYKNSANGRTNYVVQVRVMLCGFVCARLEATPENESRTGGR